MATQSQANPAPPPPPPPIDLPDEQILALPDGRKLAYAIYGDASPAAPTVFYFHGFPGSHREALGYAQAAKRRGVRLVAVSRPGMGGSSFQTNRRILDWPADVRALADHVDPTGRTPFAVAGISGGGPYALACWHADQTVGTDGLPLLPRARLAGCAVVCGIGPVAMGLGGMLRSSRALFFVAPWATPLVAAGFDWSVGRMAARPDGLDAVRAEAAAMYLGGGRGEADRRAWEDAGADAAAMREGLVRSTADSMQGDRAGMGAAWEARVLAEPWGFELGALEGGGEAVTFWHGDADVNVPVHMARRSAELVKGSGLKLCPGEAHLSAALKSADEVLQTLVELIGKAGK
ncbi:hypothetical protein RB599_010492 [Gaeumannomyces hyphopodioides]